MKILKYLLIVILLLAIGLFIFVKVASEDLPKGQSGNEADDIAEQVMAGLNKSAFDQIPYLQWEFFRPGQKYLWDKKNNKAIIEWGDNKVIMNLNTQEAKSYVSGVEQSGAEHDKLKTKAWSNWCNDSFWMIAPYKLFDPGTTRELVPITDGTIGNLGLKVTYTTGGVTPGDSYLWYLDENLRPYKYKMWTSILPLKGLESGWTGWEEHGGALLSTTHSLMGKEVTMKNVKAGNSWSEFGFTQDPFQL